MIIRGIKRGQTPFILSDEIPQVKQIKDELIIKKIKKEVIKAFKVKNENLYSSVRGKENIARMMAIGLARECSELSYGKIAQIFGGINYKSAAKYYERIKQRCELNEKLKRVFAGLRKGVVKSRLDPLIFKICGIQQKTLVTG